MYFQDTSAGRLQPGQEPTQRRLIGKRTVDHGFGRFGGSAEVIEVQQDLGRNGPCHADLVVVRGSQQVPPALLSEGGCRFPRYGRVQRASTPRRVIPWHETQLRAVLNAVEVRAREP